MNRAFILFNHKKGPRFSAGVEGVHSCQGSFQQIPDSPWFQASAGVRPGERHSRISGNSRQGEGLVELPCTILMPTSKTIGDTITCEQYDTVMRRSVLLWSWNLVLIGTYVHFVDNLKFTCLAGMGHVPLAGRQGMAEGMCCSDAALPSKCMVGNSRR